MQRTLLTFTVTGTGRTEGTLNEVRVGRTHGGTCPKVPRSTMLDDPLAYPVSFTLSTLILRSDVVGVWSLLQRATGPQLDVRFPSLSLRLKKSFSPSSHVIYDGPLLKLLTRYFKKTKQSWTPKPTVRTSQERSHLKWRPPLLDRQTGKFDREGPSWTEPSILRRTHTLLRSLESLSTSRRIGTPLRPKPWKPRNGQTVRH